MADEDRTSATLFVPFGVSILARACGAIELLIERVDYDVEEGSVSFTYRPTGFRELAEEFKLEETVA